MGLSMGELVVILVIVALLFGTGKLRNLGPDIGNAIKGFRNALRDDGKDSPDQSRQGAAPENSTAKSETRPSQDKAS